MAVLNGTLMQVEINGETLDLQTECSISLNMELRDVTNKTSGGYKQSLPGLKSGSINFSALHDELEVTNGANMQTLFTHWVNSGGAALAGVKFTTGTTGDYEFESDGFISSMEMSAGTEDNVTISGTIELDGAITYTVI